ncbi:hypothetical protein KKF91_17540, partial [Myxococcota bacterium]|nr:hypothetical protein [Myxococcota bacterium]
SSQPAWIWASGERRISHTPTQFALTTSRLIVAPGDTLALRVQSIHRQGGVFIDAWHGARWLATSALTLAEGSGVARLTVPDPGQDPALLWVQAYQTTYLPGRSRGGQYVLVSRKSPLEALDWLRAMLIKDPQAPPSLDALPRSDDPLLVEYLLGRIERPQRDPPLLADSGVSAKQTVALLKSTWQRRFAVGLLSSGAVLLLGLFFLVYYNTRQVTQGWAAAGGDEEGDKGTRKHALLDAAYILIILALFLFGLVQLLLSIHW